MAAQRQRSPEDYRARVARYETEIEPLARIFGILGRWGGATEDRIAGEVLSDLAVTGIESGSTWWLDLRFYPAVLLSYAFGLGVLKTGRFDRLYQLFALPVRQEHEDTRPFAVRVVRWWHETHERWKMLQGLDRAKTPLSQHLYKVTAGWVADYTVSDQDHAITFGMFEILRSLAYLTLDASKERLEQALAQSADSGHNYVWAPASRLSFDHRGREHVMGELGRPEGLSALSKAGYGKGDERHVNLALESVKRLMAKMDFFG